MRQVTRAARAAPHPGSAIGSSSTPLARRRSTSSGSMPSNPVQISRVCCPGSGAGELAGAGISSERNGACSIAIGSRPGCSNVRRKSRAWSCGSSSYSAARCMKPAGTPAACSAAVTSRGRRCARPRRQVPVDLGAPREATGRGGEVLALRPVRVAELRCAGGASRRRRGLSPRTTRRRRRTGRSPKGRRDGRRFRWPGPRRVAATPRPAASPICIRMASACDVAISAPRPDRRRPMRAASAVIAVTRAA